MFKIYWTEQQSAKSLDATNVVEALAACERLRKDPANSFVTLVSENPDMVGKPGAAGISDNTLPNGEVYDWRKERQMRRE